MAHRRLPGAGRGRAGPGGGRGPAVRLGLQPPQGAGVVAWFGLEGISQRELGPPLRR